MTDLRPSHYRVGAFCYPHVFDARRYTAIVEVIANLAKLDARFARWFAPTGEVIRVEPGHVLRKDEVHLSTLLAKVPRGGATYGVRSEGDPMRDAARLTISENFPGTRMGPSLLLALPRNEPQSPRSLSSLTEIAHVMIKALAPAWVEVCPWSWGKRSEQVGPCVGWLLYLNHDRGPIPDGLGEAARFELAEGTLLQTTEQRFDPTNVEHREHVESIRASFHAAGLLRSLL